MIYLVFYDIQADKLRAKMAKRLIAEGFERIQLSVYSGLYHPKNNTSLWQQLKDWAQQDVLGKLYVIACTKYQFSHMVVLGKDNLDIEYLIGQKNVIFI